MGKVRTETPWWHRLTWAQFTAWRKEVKAKHAERNERVQSRPVARRELFRLHLFRCEPPVRRGVAEGKARHRSGESGAGVGHGEKNAIACGFQEHARRKESWDGNR